MSSPLNEQTSQASTFGQELHLYPDHVGLKEFHTLNSPVCCHQRANGPDPVAVPYAEGPWFSSSSSVLC